jgi:hypothetical protein
MHFFKALTAAIVGAIIVASSASADSSIGCDSGKPEDSSVTATTCSVFDHEGASSQAYASAPRTDAAANRGYFVPFTDRRHRDPHKTDISGGAGN